MAAELGLARYRTGRPCLRGHYAERFSASRRCVECSRQACSNAYRKDLETNREKAKVKQERYRAADPKKYQDETTQRVREWRLKNPKLYAEHARKWRAENPEVKAAQCAARRAGKAKRTPAWLSEKQRTDIACAYKTARRITDETMVEHQVDHIVPLNGVKVCGLHVPWNLQVITARNNRRKQNVMTEV